MNQPVDAVRTNNTPTHIAQHLNRPETTHPIPTHHHLVLLPTQALSNAKAKPDPEVTRTILTDDRPLVRVPVATATARPLPDACHMAQPIATTHTVFKHGIEDRCVYITSLI